METLDTLVTYAYDFVLAASALYLGSSLTLYLVKRWQEIEVKPKIKTRQAVNIPLALKAQQTEAIALEAAQPAALLEAAPVRVEPAPKLKQVEKGIKSDR